jgi:hypothetical protein
MKVITSNYTRWKLGLGLILIIFAAQLLIVLPHAFAGSLSSTSVRLSRLSAGQDAKVRLVFTTASAGATSVSINFSGSWTGSSGTVNTTQTVSSASCNADTGATALPGSITAAGSGSTITISSVTALSATTAYCVDLTSATAVHTPTAGTYSLTVTAGSDSTTVVENIVSSNADQITVSATVSPSFTFSLSSNSASFASALSASSPSASQAAINSQVSTNAAAGWQMWIADFAGTPGLRSVTANKTIAYSPSAGAAAATLTNGNEGFNVGAGNHTGTCNGTFSYDSQFDNTAGTSFKGGGLDGTLRSFAKATSTASSCAVPLTFNASISNTTPAATDYSATATVVAAGNF